MNYYNKIYKIVIYLFLLCCIIIKPTLAIESRMNGTYIYQEEVTHIQHLILDDAAFKYGGVTWDMITQRYGREVFVIITMIICILVLSIFSNILVNNKLKLQNKKYELLAQISNEYIFDYDAKTDELKLSEKSIEIFGEQRKFNKVSAIIKNVLLNRDITTNAVEVKLPLNNGSMGVFKLVYSKVYNDVGNLDSIVGKLIDISEDIALREELITKAQVDGLTGLYNAETAKELINRSIENKQSHKIDAFVVVDCDKFKGINDNYGHLIGDHVLENVSKILKRTFRQTDIIGRIGGDEFCVFMKDIPSASFAYSRCEQLNRLIQEENPDFKTTVSIGVAFLGDEKSYKELFKRADDALYEAKRRGRGQAAIYEE